MKHLNLSVPSPKLTNFQLKRAALASALTGLQAHGFFLEHVATPIEALFALGSPMKVLDNTL